jgi:ElaB/YqjD/DUF883 family membrane-anchored ribosome-binding protein
MKKQTEAKINDLGSLYEDAQALIAATVDVAGDKVSEARERLSTAIESAKKMAERVREQTDEAVRENPYKAIGIALGVGALTGFLLSRRCSRKSK